MFLTEDPRLIRKATIPKAEPSQRAVTSGSGARRKLKKDVNFNGTNRRSPLESTKV
jgi:hypothetical protein